MVPKKIFFTKGVGRHKHELQSFELALRSAGIEKCNIVAVSSIVPPDCKILLKKKGMKFHNEKVLSVDELKEGMVLTRPLYSSNGRFLIPHRTKLTNDFIQKLLAIHERDPIPERIYVLVEQ